MEEATEIQAPTLSGKADREAILARGRTAFREQLENKGRKFSVSLFADSLVLTFWLFPMTLQEKGSIHREWNTDRFRGLAKMILVRLRNEDRSRVFQDGDMHDLLSGWPAEDVELIADAINRYDAETTGAIAEAERMNPGN